MTPADVEADRAVAKHRMVEAAIAYAALAAAQPARDPDPYTPGCAPQFRAALATLAWDLGARVAEFNASALKSSQPCADPMQLTVKGE